MIFKRLNRTSPEQVFAVFQAAEAGISADDPVQIDTSSQDGVAVEQPATSAAEATNLTIGVADAAIANGAYGLVQIYGYRSTGRVLALLTSIAAGVALRPVSDVDYFETAAAHVAIAPNFALVASVAQSASTGTVSTKIFIRCM
jgi:hypothetical protein